MLADDPGARPYVDQSCRERWGDTLTSRRIADAVLALGPERPSASLTVAAARARLPNVRWSARPSQRIYAASGDFGDQFNVDISPPPGSSVGIVRGWQGEEETAYDVPAALVWRGATLTSIGCENLGFTEKSQAYRVNAPGRAPFILVLGQRAAPTANSESSYGVTVDISGAAPSLARLRTMEPYSQWQPRCAD